MQIEEIFEAARRLPPPERDAYLSEACGADEALRREVESLLAHDAQASGEFLDPPGANPELDKLWQSPEPDPLIGKSVGAYRVVRLIARGGMGAVYLAEQANPRREVALKVLGGALWSSGARRRFEHESQILARLQHPNVAQVYEAGVGRIEGEKSRSVPFFAMEFVPDGRPITQYCDKHDLSIERRLELFLQVCDAVSYGHSRSVIHRDIKPANILVADNSIACAPDPSRARDCPSRARQEAGSIESFDSTRSEKTPNQSLAREEAGSTDSTDGLQSEKTRSLTVAARKEDAARKDAADTAVAHVKLIDFGVARTVDSDVALTTMHTETGQLIGTLAYMSPEQCDADPLGLDVRSDVYSLGVVLYEIVCGRLPYDVSKTSIVAAARTIREVQPPRPGGELVMHRRMRRGRRGDLETIVMKCLEKERHKRYAGADDLAADIRRWLAGDAIDARPPTAWTKGLRWVGRHPLVTTAGAAVSIGLAIVLGTLLLSYYVLEVRPDRIEVYDDRRAAKLVTLSGEVLHEWPENAAAGVIAVNDAVLVERPAKLGGGRLAVIGYSHGSGGRYANELCAYEIENELSVPLWHKQIEDDQLPVKMLAKNRHGKDCMVRAILAADVFTEVEGKELVVAHTLGSYSQHALRIYDLDGELLYQVWQDGGIHDLRWLREYRRLVCFGTDEALKLRAQETLKEFPQPPYAAFAIDPTIGAKTNEIMEPNRIGGPYDPVWYRYLHPLPKRDLDYEARMERPAGASHGAVAQIVIYFENAGRSGPGFSIPIDANGEEILPTSDMRGVQPADYRVRSDPYRQLVADGKLPPDDVFKLSDEPPMIDEKESTIEDTKPASKSTAP